jgi:hypothetical protein
MQHRRKLRLLSIRQPSNLRQSLGARALRPLMWLLLPMNNRVQMSKQPMSQLHRPGRHEHAVRQSQSSKKLHRQVLRSQWLWKRLHRKSSIFPDRSERAVADVRSKTLPLLKSRSYQTTTTLKPLVKLAKLMESPLMVLRTSVPVTNVPGVAVAAAVAVGMWLPMPDRTPKMPLVTPMKQQPMRHPVILHPAQRAHDEAVVDAGAPVNLRQQK